MSTRTHSVTAQVIVVKKAGDLWHHAALNRLPTRHKLLLYSAGCIFLSLIALIQVQSVYRSAYEFFDGIVSDNSVKVDAAIQSVQHIASVNKYAADTIGGLTPESQQTARTLLYGEFQGFRNQMFMIRAGLHKPEELGTFTAVEAQVYQAYWTQISLLIDAQEHKNKPAALQAFNAADSIFENRIAPIMRRLEQQNYAIMLEAANYASNRISADTFWLMVMLVFLALLYSALSFWLRFRVRRVLTPGFDLAFVVAWVLVFAIILQLGALSWQLRVMVQDAYYSVIASSHVLADANRANVTESAALNDPANAALWQTKFDNNIRLIALRMCGQPDCLKTPFAMLRPDVPDQNVVSEARRISQQDSQLIDNVTPLVGNVTFAGETSALEQSRIALRDYLKIDAQMRALLAAGQFDAAITLNTGTKAGQSDEAFSRFTTAMQRERQINHEVFDSTWKQLQDSLPASQRMYGIGGYLLLIFLCIGGVIHRFREL